MSANPSVAYTSLAFALAVCGGGFGATLARSHRRLCALISLGAGTLFGVTLFGILPESFASLRWWGLLLAVGGEILHRHKALVLANFAAGVALIGTLTLLLRLSAL